MTKGKNLKAGWHWVLSGLPQTSISSQLEQKPLECPKLHWSRRFLFKSILRTSKKGLSLYFPFYFAYLNRRSSGYCHIYFFHISKILAQECLSISMRRLYLYCYMHSKPVLYWWASAELALLARMITGTFLLAQTCMFIIAITLRPHSDWRSICSQQEAGDIQ